MAGDTQERVVTAAGAGPAAGQPSQLADDTKVRKPCEPTAPASAWGASAWLEDGPAPLSLPRHTCGLTRSAAPDTSAKDACFPGKCFLDFSLKL